MDALAKLPPELRNRDSIRAMADSLDRAKRTAAELRAEVKAGPSLMRVALPGFIGAFAAGYADAKMPTIGGGKVQTSAAAGLVLVTGGYFTGYESAVWAGLAALQQQAYAAGVNQAGYTLAILEPETPAAGASTS